MEATISNVGPIRSLSIPIPEEGGVVVLRGRNGQGKSYALEACQRAISGKSAELRPTDGKAKGEVDFAGIHMTVARSVRRTGELDCVTLEGRLSIADLVDPGIDNVEAADAKRIKALVNLVGGKPDASLFHDIVGGRDLFEGTVSSAAIGSDDLVTMAARIKRDWDLAARAEEDGAEKAKANAAAQKKSCEDVDLSQCDDAEALQAKLEAAIARLAGLESRLSSAREASKVATSARTNYDTAQESYRGPTVEDAERSLHEQEKMVAIQESKIASIRQQLARLEQELELMVAERASRERALASAESHFAAMATWKEQIAVSNAESIETLLSEIQAAKLEKEDARTAQEAGVMVRKAKAALATAEAEETRAKKHAKNAEHWRGAAKKTDDVLSEVIQRAGLPLKVDGGRLVLTTESRGETYYQELSLGERWRVALDIAVRAVGAGGVLVVPQEAWEGLDPINRAAIAERVAGTGVVLVTAECDETDLSAEVYESTGAGA